MRAWFRVSSRTHDLRVPAPQLMHVPTASSLHLVYQVRQKNPRNGTAAKATPKPSIPEATGQGTEATGHDHNDRIHTVGSY